MARSWADEVGIAAAVTARPSKASAWLLVRARLDLSVYRKVVLNHILKMIISIRTKRAIGAHHDDSLRSKPNRSRFRHPPVKSRKVKGLTPP